MPHSLQGGVEVFSQNNIETLLVQYSITSHSVVCDSYSASRGRSELRERVGGKQTNM